MSFYGYNWFKEGRKKKGTKEEKKRM